MTFTVWVLMNKEGKFVTKGRNIEFSFRVWEAELFPTKQSTEYFIQECELVGVVAKRVQFTIEDEG